MVDLLHIWIFVTSPFIASPTLKSWLTPELFLLFKNKNLNLGIKLIL